jgi:filamentous hemagglutinin family protein
MRTIPLLQPAAIAVAGMAVAGLAISSAANAGPTGGTVKAGTASIAQSGTSTTITQTSNRAVIDWRSFNTAPTESVTFVQPGAQAAVLNRVTGSQASTLAGSLTANGQVYLVNPNGVFISNGATINAGSLFVTTANIANAEFMTDAAAAAGRYRFDQLTSRAGSAAIVNAGTITVADGGLVAFVAPGVKNTGTITARLGTIELASATHFTLDLAGDDLLRLALDDSVAASIRDSTGTALTSQVTAGGQITADGGRVVLLSVPAAAGLVSDAINLSGVVRARSIAGNAGSIELLATGGVITIGGTADVSSATAGVAGGEIDAIGGNVHLASTAVANASGPGGGGRITLGGSYASGSATTETSRTTVDAGAQALACGTSACAADGTGGTGAGGIVRVYSAQGTSVAGRLSVNSSSAAQAGIIETISNLGLTQLAATANLQARSGEGQTPGFIAVTGSTLDVNAAVSIDLRDTANQIPVDVTRAIYDTDPALGTRNYVMPQDVAAGNDHLQTDFPLLFHAYAPEANVQPNTYAVALPPIGVPGSNIFASGREAPVGSLRPTGGAPSSLIAGSAGVLTAIPISLSSLPPDSGAVNNLVSQATTDVVLADALDRPAGQLKPNANDIGTMSLWVGGPGVGQLADLGRTSSLGGASIDVFSANFHVLSPRGGEGDTQIADYLCRSPYQRDACK